jgi:hypothetical protein
MKQASDHKNLNIVRPTGTSFDYDLGSKALSESPFLLEYNACERFEVSKPHYTSLSLSLSPSLPLPLLFLSLPLPLSLSPSPSLFSEQPSPSISSLLLERQAVA